VAPAAPLRTENITLKLPNSPGYAGCDQTQIRGWIAQLRQIFGHNSESTIDDKLNILYALKLLEESCVKVYFTTDLKGWDDRAAGTTNL